MKRPAILITLAFAVTIAWAVPTSAAMQVEAVTGPAAKYYGYVTPAIVVDKGGQITYTNFDLERHNVVQDVNFDGIHGSSKAKWCGLFDKGRCPVFYSPLIGLGQSTKVQGLKAVKPGTLYTFYCTLHPGMKGKLLIRP